MASYVVTAGYVTVQTAVSGGRAAVDIPRGATLPDDVPAEQRETLLARGDIAVVTVALAAEPEWAGLTDGTIAEVLARVGGDPNKAAEALMAEEAKGAKARSTLVRDLAAIANA